MFAFSFRNKKLTLFPSRSLPFDLDSSFSSPFNNQTGDDLNAKSTKTPPGKHIIYEVGVRPFTAAGGFERGNSKDSEDALKGTFAGLAARAPYLASLGVTAVELLPIFEYDELEFRCEVFLFLFLFFSFERKEKGKEREREMQKNSLLPISLFLSQNSKGAAPTRETT